MEDISTKDLDDAVKSLLNQTLGYNRSNPARAAENNLLSMPRYEAFRNVDHLSETATELYKAAGRSTLGTMTVPWLDTRANICVMKA